jgi:hypothetical protein
MFDDDNARVARRVERLRGKTEEECVDFKKIAEETKDKYSSTIPAECSVVGTVAGG